MTGICHAEKIGTNENELLYSLYSWIALRNTKDIVTVKKAPTPSSPAVSDDAKGMAMDAIISMSM